jgi:hypothetical protein
MRDGAPFLGREQARADALTRGRSPQMHRLLFGMDIADTQKEVVGDVV